MMDTTTLTEVEVLRAKMRAAAGWISNLADTLDEDPPEWSIVSARESASGDFKGSREWMNDTWTDYLG
jgi:hypothetical protein